MPETPQIPTLENYYPVVNVQDVGPCVLVPTAKIVKFSENMSVEAALNAMNEQISASAAQVARMDAELADTLVWLADHHGYIKGEPNPAGEYFVHAYAPLAKVPSDASPETPQE